MDGFGRLPCLSFGSEGMQERLAALVIAGRKRATVWVPSRRGSAR